MSKLSILFAAVLVAAGADEAFLLRNVSVHPVSGPDLANSSILVRDGKIAEIGLKAAPKGVRVIDAKGLHVYPGMIDSATQIGLSEISSVRETNDTGELGPFNPQLRALIAVNPESEHIAVTRVNGITTVITMPGSAGGGGGGGRGGGAAASVIPGQASLLHLDGWTWEEMEIRRSAAMQLQFPVLQTTSFAFGAGDGGVTRTPLAEARRRYDTQLRELSEFFEKSRRYRTAKASAGPGFRPDLRFEAMIPVLEGKQPMLVSAIRERAIRDAVQFAEKEKIRIILAGVRRPGKMLAELKAKNIPVILGNSTELPLEQDDPYDASFTLPAELHKAGVKFAFGSFGNQFARNLPYEAGFAVGFGLPHAEALKALTINPAEIWGVAEQVGSIDKGKWADLMVTDGDPLDARTQVKQLYIKGKSVDVESKHTRLYKKYLNRP